jgi:S-adenosylmethionine:tRNA ribosyltransferase-isomerase
MRISEFDYALPEELIAQEPLEQRDASRMLILDRKRRSWIDSQFAELPDYLKPGDVLVINNTRVFPARLSAQRDPSGGKVEVLLVRELEPLLWETLIRPGHRLKPGARLRFQDPRVKAEVVDSPGKHLRVLRFECDGSFELMLDELGQTPLPPYIKRTAGSTPADRERYQTVYASASGAIAAPTAGLHLTKLMMDELQTREVKIVEITLHVGYGTFEPVRVAQVEEHRVASERFAITATAAATINEARIRGARVFAVGTTTTRALESGMNAAGQIQAVEGTAELTITPGYAFRAIDALITNFHLPRSSLLMLVCAFADRELVLDAYRHAVEAHYRFYSYGDCMLIL